MNLSIEHLIDNATDYELCRAVFNGLDKKYGNKIDATIYTQEARIVILADHARGIIGNGGFRYLFEGDFPGDPGFRLTLEAFETIGVRRAVSAFKKALAAFPNSRPPTDIETRIHFFIGIPYARRHKVDKEFWDADDEITQKLAKYIRFRRRAFIDMNIPIADKRT